MLRYSSIITLCFFLTSHVAAEVVTIGYPDYVRNSRPVVEFRARETHVAGDAKGFTHAYILLGRQYANDEVIFYGGAGFYPEPGKKGAVTLFRMLFTGPGKVTFTAADKNPDTTFRLRVTEEQTDQIKYLIKNFDDKDYNLASSNCVDLVRGAAGLLGLEIGKAITPIGLVKFLANENDPDKPLRHAIKERKRAVDIKLAGNKTMKAIYEARRKRAAEVAASMAEWAAWDASHRMQNVGMAPTASPTENSLQFSPLSPTWPWPEPPPQSPPEQGEVKILKP